MTLRQWLHLYHLVLGFAVIASIANAAQMCKPVTGHNQFGSRGRIT